MDYDDDDYDSEVDSTAERLYEKLGEESDFDKCNLACVDKSKKLEVEYRDDVTYHTYTFFDDSKLTIGNNGYLGSETPIEERP